jgi:hypothetical protein
MLPWVVRHRRTRFLLITFACSAAGLISVVYFFPHYAAPVTAVTFALLIQCMRHMRRLEFRGRPVGIFLTRLIVLVIISVAGSRALHLTKRQKPWSIYRAEISKRLKALPGNDLILVQYSPAHNADHEWVWNRAEIDQSKIVWAREIPGVDITPLLDYFHDRKVWLLEADAVPPKLLPFREEQIPAKTARSGNLTPRRGAALPR